MLSADDVRILVDVRDGAGASYSPCSGRAVRRLLAGGYLTTTYGGVALTWKGQDEIMKRGV